MFLTIHHFQDEEGSSGSHQRVSAITDEKVFGHDAPVIIAPNQSQVESSPVTISQEDLRIIRNHGTSPESGSPILSSATGSVGTDTQKGATIRRRNLEELLNLECLEDVSMKGDVKDLEVSRCC